MTSAGLKTRTPMRRARAACTCAAIGDEHAFMCPARPRRQLREFVGVVDAPSGQLARGKGGESFTRPARKRINPRRATPRRSGRVRDRAFEIWVHTRPCAAIGLPGHVCNGPVQADHQGRRAFGRKANDDTEVALCPLAHLQRDAFKGPFKTWDHDRMRAWLDDNIAATQAAYQIHLAALDAGDAIPF